MKKPTLLRLLSFILVVTLLVQMVPVRTFADTTDTETEITEEQAPITIVGEEEHLRTETEKHFRMSDGSYMAVSYGLPMHYQDEDGAWQDIDNSLTTATTTTGQTVYGTDVNGTATLFSSTLADGKLYTTAHENVAVSMYLVDPTVADRMTATDQGELDTFPGGLISTEQPTLNENAVASIITEEPSVLTETTEGWTIEDLFPETYKSTIMYEDVFPDVDLIYTTYSYNIKEEIVVNAPKSEYRYDFILEMTGLTAQLNEDGSVSLLDAENVVNYRIPAPYMMDASGAVSYDVVYTLSQVEGGTLLIVTADKEWANSGDRVFPITIDPTLIVDVQSNSKLESEGIYATYVVEGQPTSHFGEQMNVYMGYASTSDEEYQAYVHIKNLPAVPTGTTVCDASLNMYMWQFDTAGISEMPIAAYEVTEGPPSSVSGYYEWICWLTWNTKPAFDTNNAIDYVITSSNTVGEYISWNLTELTKKWYIENTENRTIALCVPGAEENGPSGYALPAVYAFAEICPPIFTVSYRNTTGIEPYYSYATLGVGQGGTAYTADSTGQLKVTKEVVSYASTINPFSLNLVYNSDYFAVDNASDYHPPVQLGLDMYMGSGWTLDVIQKVEAETISGVEYLRYHDGDGTVHYFWKDTSDGQYHDEDGLGLTISGSGSSYTMSDEKGNSWIFTNGFLTSFSDESGNQYLINYSGNKISTIQQKNKGANAITVATFGYTDDYVSSITDATGTVTYLGYTGEKLTTVTRATNLMAEYAYTDTGSGYRATRITDSLRNYSIAFTYTHGKVSSYQEFGEGISGAGCSISYPNYSETVYRDYGLDRLANTNDDILTHFLFDNFGRTANAYTTDVNGTVLSATNAVYTSNTGTSKDNNRTQRTASIGIAGQQLMQNYGLESGTGWTMGGTGTNRTISISTTKPRTGQYSVEGNDAGASGTISATRTSNTLEAGKEYTFSAYVNTTGITHVAGSGIYLQVRDTSGNTWKSNCVNYTTASTMDDGWVRISVTFTAAVSGAHTVGVYADRVTGTFFADDFQLEKGSAPSKTNLLENGNIDVSNYGWNLGNGASYSSKGTLKIMGDPKDASTNASQTVTVNLPSTQTYVLSGWVQANAVPDNVTTASEEARDTVKQCGLRAVLTYSDGSVEYHYAPFNTDLSKWQFVSYTIVPKESTKIVSTIKVICAYEKNANIAHFDDLSLVREAAQTMKYDEDGNLTSVTTSGLSEQTNSYSGSDLIRTVTGGNGTYEYTYDGAHRLTGVRVMNLATSDTTDTLLSQTIGYNTYGNVTSTELTGTGSLQLKSEASYSNYGNLLESVTNSNGGTTSYTYSTANHTAFGLPSAITNANGTTYSQTTDIFGRLRQVDVANTNRIGYTFYKFRPHQIKRLDFSGNTHVYLMEYDNYSNVSRITIGTGDTGKVTNGTFSPGTVTLATYEYGAKNGPLAKQTYGNGDSISFTYDDLGRNKTTTYSGGRTLSYTYTGDGQLHSITDNTQGKYVYTYDALGRLIASQRYDGNNNFVMGTHQTYNEHNQLTGQSWQLGSTGYSESYTYDSSDGSLSAVTSAVGQTLSYQYDYLRRLGSVSTGVYTRNYIYRDISTTQTTTQVSRVSYSGLSSNPAYAYTYDAMGNILTYTAPDGEIITYTYDNQNQLTRAAGSTTYNYTYDVFGNVLSNNYHSFTYGNNGWGDLLVTVDGQGIAYEGQSISGSTVSGLAISGNPISYYNGTRWTFDWAEGRNLVSASGGGNTITYAYDHNGVRTNKTVNGVVHTYHYASGKLLRETYGSNTLDFFYDASGMPFAVSHNGTVYYYITNLQGDVMQLVDANGTKVAEYEYDPYGTVISATGTMAEINPLRYRGYYYDTETGLYYVSSRYYDPEIGRWINADDTAYLGEDGTLISYNLFAYCKNNPVMGYDPTGHFSWTDVFNTAAVVTIAALAVIAIVGSGGSAAPPLLAAASALAGTTVTAAAATTVATGVAITGVATMGAAATASILESSSKQGKDYVQARNNKQANQWAQEVGYDGAEELKADYVGKQGSKFNMYTNRATGEIILIGLKVAKEIATQLFRW